MKKESPPMRTPAGEVSKRLKAKAIKVLAATIDDPGVPMYVKALAARSLLAQSKPKPEPAEADDDFPPAGTGARIVILKRGEKFDPAIHDPDGTVGVILPEKDKPHHREGSGKVIILPDNGRENIAEERQRLRLAHFAELPIPDEIEEVDPPPEVPAPAAPRKLTGKELLQRLRAKRRSTREAVAL
jgi:hypothetical protein